jgi:hypothetical protein
VRVSAKVRLDRRPGSKSIQAANLMDVVQGARRRASVSVVGGRALS